jgi:hypothetical protein
MANVQQRRRLTNRLIANGDRRRGRVSPTRARLRLLASACLALEDNRDPDLVVKVEALLGQLVGHAAIG